MDSPDPTDPALRVPSTLRVRAVWGSRVGTVPLTISQAYFADDGATLWLYGRDGTGSPAYAALALDDGTLRGCWPLPADPARDLPDTYLVRGDRLVRFGRSSARLEAWDLRTATRLFDRTITTPPAPAGCCVTRDWIVITNDGDGAAVYDRDGTFRRTLDRVRNVVSISHDERWLATRDLQRRDDRFELVEIATGETRAAAIGRAGLSPSGMRFLPDGQLLITPDKRSRELCFLDIATGVLTTRPVDGVPWYFDSVRHGVVVFSERKLWLVTGVDAIREVDVRRPFSGPVQMVAAPGGRRWATWSGAAVQLHTAEPAPPPWRPKCSSVLELRAAPNGARVALRDADGAVRLVDTASGRARFAGWVRRMDRGVELAADERIWAVSDSGIYAVDPEGARAKIPHGLEIVWWARLAPGGQRIYVHGSRTGAGLCPRVVPLDGSPWQTVWRKRLLDFRWIDDATGEYLRLLKTREAPALLRARWQPGPARSDLPRIVVPVPAAIRNDLEGEGAARVGGMLLARGVLLTLGARLIFLRDDGTLGWELAQGRVLDASATQLLVRDGLAVRIHDMDSGAVVAEADLSRAPDDALCGVLRADGRGAWLGTRRGLLLAADVTEPAAPN